MRWNRFRVCSACDKFVPRMLSMDCTCKSCSHFTAGWACAEIRSSYAQCAMKLVPRMLSIRMLKFSKNTQKYQIQLQILTIRNQNFQKPYRSPPKRTKVNILKEKNFLDSSSKIFGSAYGHRGNARTSKFWQKSMEKKQNLRRAYKDLI